MATKQPIKIQTGNFEMKMKKHFFLILSITETIINIFFREDIFIVFIF